MGRVGADLNISRALGDGQVGENHHHVTATQLQCLQTNRLRNLAGVVSANMAVLLLDQCRPDLSAHLVYGHNQHV